MLLFEKDFPNMAASRYEQNEAFFVRLFQEPDMMKQIMETLGTVLYEKLKKSDVVYSFEPKVSMVAEDVRYGKE
jgi:type I restriction enzyme R subunit